MAKCIQHQLDVRFQRIDQDRGCEFDASVGSSLADSCAFAAIDAVELRDVMS